MVFEVSGRCLILRVLKPADTTSAHFAFVSGTNEEVAGTAILSLKGDVRLEKRIERGAPGFFKCL
jgi:hypothetical protein